MFMKEGYINTEVYRASIQQTIAATGNEIANIYITVTNKVIKLLAEQQIRKAFEQSEKEVQDLHERTREGIREAKRNGKQLGRVAGAKIIMKKSLKAKKLIQEYSEDFNGTLNDIDTMVQIRARLGTLSRNSYYKYKRDIRADGMIFFWAFLSRQWKVFSYFSTKIASYNRNLIYKTCKVMSNFINEEN